MKPPLHRVFGQPSWRIASDRVDAAVTQTGGHLAPVTFRLGRRRVQPFSISPWWKETLAPGTPPILRVLRGDFFCLPFGGNSSSYRGRRHPVHGDTANRAWQSARVDEAPGAITLSLRMRLTSFRGEVTKRITLLPGHTAVYQEHTVTGVNVPTSLGHHATLQLPDRPGAGHFSTSRCVHRQVYLEPAERPEERGYSILQPGAVFQDPRRVPTLTGETADLTRFPARPGYTDLAIFCADPSLSVGWSALAVPEEGYAWFSLRDPRVLTSTLIWMSNNGRHYPPWNGRHRNVLGVEDITGLFHYGAAESARPNALSRRGIRTTLKPTAERPLRVRYIMGVAPIPRTFGAVKDIVIQPGHVTLAGTRGRVSMPLDTAFLHAAG